MGGSAGDLVRLVAKGHGRSRAELARLSGMAPSSVSLRVEELIEAGLLREDGEGASRGGRRPRQLRLHENAGVVVAVDVGTHHVRMAVLDLAGRVLLEHELPGEIAEGPERVIERLLDNLRMTLRQAEVAHLPLLGVGIGMPGPVDPGDAKVVAPSRMPGWNDFPIGRRMSELLGVRVVVENDANLMAVGEHRYGWPDRDNLMAVKAGTGIGCGIIVSGRLHRGRGAAGDISHVPVHVPEPVTCSCGHSDCLEAHASGAALRRILRGQGIDVTSSRHLVELVNDGVPEATTLVRNAGRLAGQVLVPLVNFFNPDVLVLGGGLSAAEPFVAAVRGAIYERCLPLATRDLEIATAVTGRDACMLGAGSLVLDEVLASEWVDDTLAAR
ncbi:ROK family transcriptional regulator [Embleya scabrispora]|uniref:ROK family transcriptional regulator n=1 Tax=Embleya scabrispora TaxID=159449 RepID=UPI001F162472|nr:ROK family protein [Embleya scabrispora]